ncbi:MAG: hypothetical protein CBB99_01430 [Bacteroidetes bacterium TMED39]|nr:MAG: hypothetical protein CBB99_01430 [Bacteroidetes bacterium TMED39]|tara:strand:- start:4890 stop:5126 length:237 start_codon:yes stop_codon:yes gene_type:complete
MIVNSINYSVYTGKFVPSSCQEQKVLTLTILHKLLQTAYESKLKDAEFSQATSIIILGNQVKKLSNSQNINKLEKYPH